MYVNYQMSSFTSTSVHMYVTKLFKLVSDQLHQLF